MFLPVHEKAEQSSVLDNAKNVRIGARIIFMVLFLYLSVTASRCYSQSMKLRLLKHGKIPVLQAAGWLPTNAILTPLIKVRHIPNPYWWLFMAAIVGFYQLADLATATIHTQDIPGRCPFSRGIVMDISNIWQTPYWNGPSQIIASGAQSRSLANGCQAGVYSKANSETNFCADDEDVIGHWECVGGLDKPYKYGNWTRGQVGDDLQRQGLLYSDRSGSDTGDTNYMENFDAFAVWSSSKADYAGEVFEVKAAIDTIAGMTANKMMHTMHCSLAATDVANATTSQILSRTALRQWNDLFQGRMYTNTVTGVVVEEPERELEQLLDSIVMVAGSTDDVNKSPLLTADQYYGCLKPRTQLPNWYIAMFLIVIILCLAVTILSIIQRHRLRRYPDRNEVQYAPMDSWTWMAQAVAEAENRHGIPTKDLRRWYIGRSADGGVKIEKLDASLQPLRDSDAHDTGTGTRKKCDMAEMQPLNKSSVRKTEGERMEID